MHLDWRLMYGYSYFWLRSRTLSWSTRTLVSDQDALRDLRKMNSLFFKIFEQQQQQQQKHNNNNNINNNKLQNCHCLIQDSVEREKWLFKIITD